MSHGLQSSGADFELGDFGNRIEMAGGQLIGRFPSRPMIRNENRILANRLNELRRKFRRTATRNDANQIAIADIILRCEIRMNFE